jgi:hypothetical protein
MGTTGFRLPQPVPQRHADVRDQIDNLRSIFFEPPLNRVYFARRQAPLSCQSRFDLTAALNLQPRAESPLPPCWKHQSERDQPRRLCRTRGTGSQLLSNGGVLSLPRDLSENITTARANAPSPFLEARARQSSQGVNPFEKSCRKPQIPCRG